MRRTALVCALAASLNAACWSAITPPFQAPDEPSHFAYVQRLAETAQPPTSSGFAFSPEEEAALRDLHQAEVLWHPEVPTISSRIAQAQLRKDLARPLSRASTGDGGVATSQPPAYYALEAVPYLLGSHSTLLDRLELMRLASALMAGLTALCCFLFVRECLPAEPWAWTVGGLSVALFPLLGFTSGAVTPDALLVAVSSAIFFCLACAFRRGLSRRLALALGALTLLGFLTKLNFLGLAPGVLLGFALLARRRIRDDATGVERARYSVALALAFVLTPMCIYTVHDVLAHRQVLGQLSNAADHVVGGQPLLSEAARIWQLYLPRLPGMTSYYPGLSTTRQLWFNRSVGLYGWLDTSLPTWVYTLALIPACAIAALSLRALLCHRDAARRRLPELLVYLAIAAGLMILVGAASHATSTPSAQTAYVQPRYLLPLLAPLGAVLALAARGAGRRWGPPIGVAIVMLLLADDLFSQLQTVARFYG